MKVTRIYTGEDGESHFEDVEVSLRDHGAIGAMSRQFDAKGVIFRTTQENYDLDWHNAPQRQLVVMLSGGQVEIEVGDGSRRRLGPGEILLAEDTTGRGHISRAVDSESRTCLFVPLGDDEIR